VGSHLSRYSHRSRAPSAPTVYVKAVCFIKINIRNSSEIHFEDDLMEHKNGVLAGLSFDEAKKIPIPKHQK